jgi:hypothetical protein
MSVYCCHTCSRRWRVVEHPWSGERYYYPVPATGGVFWALLPSDGCPRCDGYTFPNGDQMWIAARRGAGNPAAWMLLPRD